jgi:serine phosphatase RsbU (regulator of sigma subunit)
MMNLIFKMFVLFFLVGSLSTTANAIELQPFQVVADTPIIFNPKDSALVLRDPAGSLSPEEVLVRKNEFKSAAEMGKIDAHSYYWIMQKFISRLDADREFRVEGSWLSIETFAIQSNGSILKLKPAGFGYSYSQLSDVDPTLPSSSKAASSQGLFVLRSGQPLVLLSRVKSIPALPPKSFTLRIADHARFLELRRFGLFVEGSLLGILFSLGIFGWFSYFMNKDRASLFYGIWLTLSFFQVFNLYTQDGNHFSEFMLNVDGIFLGAVYLSNIFYSFPAYGQLIFYFLFASAFLQLSRYFPTAQKFIYLFSLFFFCFFWVSAFVVHNIPPNIFFLPNAILPIAMFVIVYKCGIDRYKQGMKVALFFLIGAIPYFLFRLVFVSGLLGMPSVFSLLPESGLSYLLQNNFVSQAMALCCEAIIMALAVISRNKWIQEELIETQESQKRLIANQNKVLEATVAERTQELVEQHRALDESHQIILGSVNYASRLQRGQLPRSIRIDRRFASFSAIWQPRDVIGGDVYWLSSSLHTGPFIVAVADCTGHGVPGAMLSLLVSNSLERIYANDTTQDPTSALLSLDHYVRMGLNQDRLDSESDDGCDAAILRIDRDNHRIEFSGAKLGLFHVSGKDNLTRYSGARCSLGYHETIQEGQISTAHVIRYQAGDVFAIFTDGITDQIGGPTGKISFGYRRLEQILRSHHGSDAMTITDVIQHNFLLWQGTNTRRDDLTAIVFTL